MFLRLKKKMGLVRIAFQAKLKKRLVAPYGFGIVCDTVNGLFVVDPEDFGVGRELLRHGKYGAEELKLLDEFLTPDASVLIVGAHIGSLAIPIARKVRNLFAIEANPRTFRLLTLNFILNRIPNAQAAQIAASDRREQLSFLLSRINSGGSKRVPKIKNAIYYHDRPEVAVVEAHPLDEFLKENFDVVLMDIEGSEAFALKGMPRILSKAAMLQVEFLPHHLRNVAGIAVGEFLAPIEIHFDRLFIPSRRLTVERKDFLKTLQSMYENEEADDGMIFTKTARRA